MHESIQGESDLKDSFHDELERVLD